MQSIIVANTTITQDAEGRYSLNELHRAAGHMPKHRPSRWLRSQQVQELVVELESEGNYDVSGGQKRALASIQGFEGNGTYASWPLVYAYAMWVSPKFHIEVIRTFHRVQTEERAALAKDAEAYKSITMSSSDMLISEAALTLNVKRAEFFNLLNGGLGWIYKRGSKWWPRQKAVEAGYVARRCHQYTDEEGDHRSYQTVITERGMAFAQQFQTAA